MAAWANWGNANAPQTFGTSLVFSSAGDTTSAINFAIETYEFGTETDHNTTVAQLLSQFSLQPTSSTVQSYSWLNYAISVDGFSSYALNDIVNNSIAPFNALHDTFFAKSVMIPSNLTLTSAMLQPFTNYLASNGSPLPSEGISYWVSLITSLNG